MTFTLSKQTAALFLWYLMGVLSQIPNQYTIKNQAHDVLRKLRSCVSTPNGYVPPAVMSAIMKLLATSRNRRRGKLPPASFEDIAKILSHPSLVPEGFGNGCSALDHWASRIPEKDWLAKIIFVASGVQLIGDVPVPSGFCITKWNNYIHQMQPFQYRQYSSFSEIVNRLSHTARNLNEKTVIQQQTIAALQQQVQELEAKLADTRRNRRTGLEGVVNCQGKQLEEVLEKLEALKCAAQASSIEEKPCRVCFKATHKKKVCDPCGHMFCENCLDLLEKCPMCRVEIVKVIPVFP